MRGATQDECMRLAVKGETLRVVRTNLPTRNPGEMDLVFALGDDVARELVFAALGTRLRITDVGATQWPEQIKTLLGDRLVGTELTAWAYLAHRRDQIITDPPVPCLCFLRSDPWGVLNLWDFEGVLVEVITDPPPPPALPTTEAQSRVVTPL